MVVFVCLPNPLNYNGPCLGVQVCTRESHHQLRLIRAAVRLEYKSLSLRQGLAHDAKVLQVL